MMVWGKLSFCCIIVRYPFKVDERKQRSSCMCFLDRRYRWGGSSSDFKSQRMIMEGQNRHLSVLQPILWASITMYLSGSGKIIPKVESC